VAYVVAAVLRGALSLKYFDQYPEVKGLLGLSVGAVKAFIILVTLAIAFSVLKLGPATVYMQEIANYLPSLAGAIILLTLGVALINILVDYIQRQVGGASNPFLASVFNILKFGLYAIIITIAVQLTIFYWIQFISPYLFYDIIIATVILVATLTITDTVVDQLLKCLPVAELFLTFNLVPPRAPLLRDHTQSPLTHWGWSRGTPLPSHPRPLSLPPS